MRDSIDIGSSNLVRQQACQKAGHINYTLLAVSILLATLLIGAISQTFSVLSL